MNWNWWQTGVGVIAGFAAGEIIRRVCAQIRKRVTEKKGETDATKKLARDHFVDWMLFLAFFAIAVLGVVAVFTKARYLAMFVIGAADVYLVFGLIVASWRSDVDAGHRVESYISSEWVMGWFFPRRIAAFFLVLLLLSCIVSGFAGLYVGTEVFGSSNDKSVSEAYYISLQTLGFSDFQAQKGYGQFVVMAELASGVLMLIGIFPLFVSRIANF